MTAQRKDESDVRMAAAWFYKAVNALFKGDVAPMVDLWSHADDVTYLGPAGAILVGWDKVLKSWKEQAALKMGGTVEVHDMHLIMSENVGITQNYEMGTINIDGKTHSVKIRAINVFRKEGGHWKMISHQTDPIPVLEKKVPH